MNRDQPRSVLIIHPGGLGDVLLSLPAIADIRTRYPEHCMMLLAGSEVGSLLVACRLVDRALSIESGDLACLMSGAEHVSTRLQGVLKSCEYVAGWLKDRDGVLRTSLKLLGIGTILLQAPTPRKGTHQSKRFLQVLRSETDTDTTVASRLLIPEIVTALGAQCLRTVGIRENQDFVVCHPGSGSLHKCVRPDTMVTVIRGLRQQGLVPVLVGGPADDETVEHVIQCGIHDVRIIQRHDLTAIAGVLAQAKLFVGHDSGLTHLAAALQVPTLAMFGPTDPLQWAPLGDHVRTVTGLSCSCPTWESVRACESKSCLTISTETIISRCLSLLNRDPSLTS